LRSTFQCTGSCSRMDDRHGKLLFAFAKAAASPSLVAILLGLFATDARAASFDCRKASIAAEVNVCTDAKLSALDDDLAAAYNSVLAQAPDPQLLRRQQREWTQFRNECARGSQDCIERLYEERVAELKGSSQTSIYHFRGFRADLASRAEQRTEPWQYASPSAEALWDFVATQLSSISDAKSAEDQRNRAMFARIGPDSFLVLIAGVYLAQPARGRWELLTPALPDDSWDLPEFRLLPRDGIWVFLHSENLRAGTYTEYFGALFIRPSRDKEPTVSFVSIASFSDEDSQLCARSADDEGEPPPSSLTAEHVESAQVMDVNGDSMEDLVFHIAKQDCKTLDIATRKEVFVNTGSGFRQLSPAEGIRPNQ
jgi:uncharacterized protein